MSIVVTLGKKVKTIFGGSALLNFFEKRFLKKYGDNNLAPIFIIGLPRSGSTLLFQVLNSKYKFSFFSNLANVFYKGPSLVLSVFKNQHRKFKLARFDSDYGYTKGFFSPSEGGSIYRDWFSENKKTDKERINKTIDAYTKIVKAPFIFKNLNISFNLETITEIFPNAFFILINRDLRFVCQSIYHSTIHEEGIHIDGLTREELLKNKDPLLELAIRLKFFDKEIKEKLSEKTSNYLQVDYSDLCSSPQKVIEDINSVYKRNSFLQKRDNTKNIYKFPESKKLKISKEEWEKLNKIFDNKK